MSRFTRWTLQSVAMFTILAGTTLVNGTTRNVPNQYPNLQAAINASAQYDAISINATYTDPGFNVTKPDLRIYGNGSQFTVTMTGLAQISNSVSFTNLYFTNNNNTRDLFQINPGKWYVSFESCLLNQGGNSLKSCIYDRGSYDLYVHNTTLLSAGYGIYAGNATLVRPLTSNFLWINRPIYYYCTATSNLYPASGPTLSIASCGFTMTSTTNGYCARAAFPNLPNNGSPGSVYAYNSNFSAYGSGSVPIALAGHCGADITYNTFYACPVPPGKEWSKTSTDYVNANNNTAVSGSNCTPGPY